MIDDARGPGEVVVHHDNRVVVGGKLHEDGAHQRLAVRVKRAHRLVHDQDVRAHRQHRRNADCLPLPAGEVGNAALAQILQVQQIEHILHAFGNLLLRHADVLQAKRDGILHAVAEELVFRVLADNADKRIVGNVEAAGEDAVADQLGDDAAENFHKRGLSAAAGADDGRHLSLLDGKVDVIQGQGSVFAVFVSDAEPGRKHRGKQLACRKST